jgi:hypothetical protein
MNKLVGSALLLALAAPSLACSLSRPSSAPVVQPSASSVPPDPPAPSLDRCKNLWLRVGGKYYEGTLVTCTTPNPTLPAGVIGGTISDGLWPPPHVEFVQVPRGSAIDIVAFDDPDAPIHLYLFAWREGLSFRDSPEQLRDESFPAARITQWVHCLDPGRYLLTAFVHWPYAGTERSFGIEVM